MSAQRTVCSPPQSQSLSVAWSSPPTYWIGFCTLGSNGSTASQREATEADSTGIRPGYGRTCQDERDKFSRERPDRSSVRPMSELMDRFDRATGHFSTLVQQIKDDQWSNPTPCSDWDVRALVNHLVYEARWVRPMLEGQTIDQVGSQFDGDLLGADPKASYDDALGSARGAITAPGATEAIVHLSSGDTPAGDYLGPPAPGFVVSSST